MVTRATITEVNFPDRSDADIIDTVDKIIDHQNFEFAKEYFDRHLSDMANNKKRIPDVAYAMDRLVEFMGAQAVAATTLKAERMLTHARSFMRPEDGWRKEITSWPMIERFMKVFDYALIAVLGDQKPGWFDPEGNVAIAREVLNVSKKALGLLREDAVFTRASGTHPTLQKALNDIGAVYTHLKDFMTAAIEQAKPDLSMPTVLLLTYAAPSSLHGLSDIPDELRMLAFKKTIKLLPALAANPDISLPEKVGALQALDRPRKISRFFADIQEDFNAGLTEALSILTGGLQNSPPLERIEGLQTIFATTLPEAMRQSIVPDLHEAYAELESENPMLAFVMKGQFIFHGPNPKERNKFCPDYIQSLNEHPDQAFVARVAWRVAFTGSHAYQDGEQTLLAVREQAFDQVIADDLPSARLIFLEASHELFVGNGKRARLMETITAETTKLLETERNNIWHQQRDCIGDPAAGD